MWFKVCDGLAFHRKVLKAGNEAMGAWVRAGAWSSMPDNLTEGWIPPEVADQIAPPRVWAKLRAAGLVEDPGDGREGHQLHDFLAYNPTAERVRADRAATKARVERFRNAARNGVTAPATNGVGTRSPASPSHPEGVQEIVDHQTVEHALPRVCAPEPARDRILVLDGVTGESSEVRSEAQPPPRKPSEADLVTVARQMADEGNPFAQRALERIAKGWDFTEPQKIRLREARSDRAPGRARSPPRGTGPNVQRDPTGYYSNPENLGRDAPDNGPMFYGEPSCEAEIGS